VLERLLRATLIAASVVAPLPASSAFVSDYSDWQKLSEVARQGFVTGAVDRLTTMISDDAEKAIANGASGRCQRYIDYAQLRHRRDDAVTAALT
jgi:hypothetical protein